MRRIVALLALLAFSLPCAASADTGPGGDIPDNQVFLTFHDRPAGYTIRYPEGWARRGGGAVVTFTDKDNSIRITVAHGRLPTGAAIRSQLRATRITAPPTHLTLPGGNAVKVTFERRAAPDPVTGKRVTLMIDRYYVAGNGRLAVLDLGTPVGVDNVDAYRLISRSFHWR